MPKLNDTEKTIAEIDQLEADIKDIDTQLFRLSTERQKVGQNKLEAQNIHRSLASRIAPAEKARFDQALKQASEFSAELIRMADEAERLSQTRDNHHKRLLSIKVLASKPELIGQFESLKADLEKQEPINIALAKQDGIIQDATQRVNSASDLNSQRCLLMAESATGIDNTDKIATIDLKIADVEKGDHAINSAKDQAAKHARETSDGLRAMLDALAVSIASKKRTLAFIYDAYLVALATAEAEKYKEAAAVLERSLQNVIAIDHEIKRLGINSGSGFFDYKNVTRIPALSNMTPPSGEYFSLYPEGGLTEDYNVLLDELLLQNGIVERIL
ncbi:hypothetical protein [Crenothrix sp.]|uniref:hypothetical protein n=1 Tax=Crenothrix sp. TaxID=3100433 RepID=UPI00374CFCD2